MKARAVAKPVSEGGLPRSEIIEITKLLEQWQKGDRAGLDLLIHQVYAELHHLAKLVLRGERLDSLGPTGLIHELYIQLGGKTPLNLENRAHFFGICGRLMRQVMIARARSRSRQKRGGHVQFAPYHDAFDQLPSSEEITQVHRALCDLERLDSARATLIELRYFAGFDIATCALALGVSEATIKRRWVLARAWLQKQLAPATLRTGKPA